MKDEEYCICEDCNRSFLSSQHEGNEKICLRCEAIFFALINDRIEYE